MDTVLTIILIGVVAGLVMTMLRPAPRPEIIYVPIEIPEERGDGMGCLPMIIIGIVVLLALGIIRL